MKKIAVADRVVVVKKLARRATVLDRECPIRVDLIDRWRWNNGATKHDPMPMTVGEAWKLYQGLGKVLKGDKS